MARARRARGVATRPVAPVDGVLIVAIGAALMFALEGEKMVLRRWGFLK